MLHSRSLGVALFITVFLSASAMAGTIDLAWDPVSDPDLMGYKVYYGTSPGSYSDVKDVGNTTSTTLSGLAACTRYYIAVKAYDTGGLESNAFSNELAGLPRPVVGSVTPSSGEQGASYTLTVAGESFDDGATVEFSGSGITVTQVRRNSCTELAVDIQIAATAPTGSRSVTVVNPDQSFGTKSSAFTVTAQDAAPTVSSTTPAAGATDVPVTVQPTVTFSEAMDASTITSTTLRLLDETGAAVAQASGSPTLSADGLTATITLAADLAAEATYRIYVVGGTSGVKDAGGTPMDADWEQSPGFTTAVGADTTGPRVTGTTPDAGASDVLVGVRPVVRFDEPLRPSSVTKTSVRLIRANGDSVPQAANSPQLSADGTSVTIIPAAELDELTTYRIRVLGGILGVKDEAGNAMEQTWTQEPGFTTENLPPGRVGNLRRGDTR